MCDDSVTHNCPLQGIRLFIGSYSVGTLVTLYSVLERLVQQPCLGRFIAGEQYWAWLCQVANKRDANVVPYLAVARIRNCLTTNINVEGAYIPIWGFYWIHCGQVGKKQHLLMQVLSKVPV